MGGSLVTFINRTEFVVLLGSLKSAGNDLMQELPSCPSSPHLTSHLKCSHVEMKAEAYGGHLHLTCFGLRSSDVDDEGLQLGARLVQLLNPASLRLPVVQQVLKSQNILLSRFN